MHYSKDIYCMKYTILYTYSIVYVIYIYIYIYIYIHIQCSGKKELNSESSEFRVPNSEFRITIRCNLESSEFRVPNYSTMHPGKLKPVVTVIPCNAP